MNSVFCVLYSLQDKLDAVIGIDKLLYFFFKWKFLCDIANNENKYIYEDEIN